MLEIKTDLLIIGAGIAGVWLAKTLKNNDFNCILLEKNAIGSFQTINSQGMLHSGVKYALQGIITADTKAIKDAPLLWQQAINNKIGIKLTKDCILSQYQYLWSNGHLATNITNFFVSKLLQSTVSRLTNEQFEEPFNHPQFNGTVYKLHETVLNLPTTLQELFNPIISNTIKIDNIELQINNKENIEKCIIDINNEKILIIAKKYIFTVGEAAETFLKLFNNINVPKMQTRPLHMVAVKARNTVLPKLFGHNIGLGQLPNISVSRHISSDNCTLWQCGGKIAEDGVYKSSEQQIDIFRKTLNKIFPWIGFNKSDYSWGSFIINRAENLRTDGKKPTHATWFPINNMIFAWPTKLVLAPIMAEEIATNIKTMLNNEDYTHSKFCNSKDSLLYLDLVKKLPKPKVAVPWWDSI